MQLLRNIDILEDVLNCPDRNFISVFHSFKAVVDACYGTTLAADFSDALSNFASDYMDIIQFGARITPKVHAVMYHIRQFCEKHNTGLGIWSEQSTESLHSDFEKTWIRYKVSSLNPNYDSQLLKAVCDYNSKHI